MRMEMEHAMPPYIKEVKKIIKQETLMIITSPGLTCKPLYLCDAGKVERIDDGWDLNRLLFERSIVTDHTKKVWSVARCNWPIVRELLGIADDEVVFQYVLIFSGHKING